MHPELMILGSDVQERHGEVCLDSCLVNSPGYPQKHLEHRTLSPSHSHVDNRLQKIVSREGHSCPSQDSEQASDAEIPHLSYNLHHEYEIQTVHQLNSFLTFSIRPFDFGYS